MSGNTCNATITPSYADDGTYFVLNFAVSVSDCNYSYGNFAYNVSYTDNTGASVSIGPKNESWTNTQGVSSFTIVEAGNQIPDDAVGLSITIDMSSVQCTCISPN
jgi:hypothetical protein